MASAYALRFPDRVAHLILADPWGFSELPSDAELAKRWPFFVKGIIFLLRPFNPLGILRFSGPLGRQY